MTDTAGKKADFPAKLCFARCPAGKRVDFPAEEKIRASEVRRMWKKIFSTGKRAPPELAQSRREISFSSPPCPARSFSLHKMKKCAVQSYYALGHFSLMGFGDEE